MTAAIIALWIDHNLNYSTLKHSIIIPTYNHCEDLLAPCVASVLNYTCMTDVELIISANGCTDNTKGYLDQLISQFSSIGMKDHLRVIWHDQPLGYARANNVAIIQSKGERIVLLNNDTLLLSQPRHQWLDLLDLPINADPSVGISCVVRGWSDPAAHHFAIFFCVMIPRHVFESVGLLNEEYGVGGGEDTEFSIEVEKAGMRVVECAEAKWSQNGNIYTSHFPIYHKGEGTVHDPNLVPDWDDVFNRNSNLLVEKYQNSNSRTFQ
jgi:O-antigen biosynthesis protein